ncbi:MAG: hypothetical protein GY788_25980 [bacterium]|nr:hypothetical protein [bacterium]
MSSLIFVFGVTIPAIYAINSRGISYYLNFSEILAVNFILLYVCLFIAMFWLASRKHPIRFVTFVSILVTIAIAQLTITSLVDGRLFSDFLTYWVKADAFSKDLTLPLQTVYDQRAFPIFYPLNLIFGNAAQVYRIFNVVALLVISLCVYNIGRSFLTATASQAAALLPLFAPEVVLSSGIVNHDIAGLLLLILGISLLTLAYDQISKRQYLGYVVLPGLAGFLLAAAELQRYPWFFAPLVIVLALALTAAGTTNKNRGKTLAPLAAVVVVSVVTMLIIQVTAGPLLRFGETVPPFDIGKVLLSHGHSYSVGSYVREARPIWTETSTIDSEYLRNAALRLLVSDFADAPYQRIRNILERGTSLFTLGSQVYYYAIDLYNEDPRFKWTYHFANRAFTFLFLVSIIFASIVIPAALRARIANNSPLSAFGFHITLLLPPILSLLMLTLFQSQSRYIFPLYFFGSLALFSAFEFVRSAFQKPRRAVFNVTGSLTSTLALGVVALAAWGGVAVAVDWLYLPDRGRVLSFADPIRPKRADAILTIGSEYVAKGPRRLVMPDKRYGFFGPYDVAMIANRGRKASARWLWCGFPEEAALTFEALAALRIGDVGEDKPKIGLSVNDAPINTDAVAGSGGEFVVVSGPVTADKKGCVRLKAVFTAGKKQPAGVLLALASLRS